MLDHIVRGDPELPPLLLLHAGGMSHREWEPFLSVWTESFRVVAPTALAHGASPRAESISIDRLVEETLGVLDHLGIGRTHILGSSMGGATALRIALSAPDRVDRLVLYRSGYRIRNGVRSALERFATPENWRRWGLEKWMSREHEPQGGPEAWKEVVRRVAWAFAGGESAGSLSATDLARVASPCLVICGDRDDLVPLEDAFEMYRTMKEAALWIVPGAGHIMGMETWRRTAFETEVRRFLLAPVPRR